MAILDFPPIESADETGLLAIGGDLEISSLTLAYQRGIFPWPISLDLPLAWFSPDPRGVLDYKNFSPPKRFLRFLRNSSLEVSFNTNFEAVIMNCARVVRKGQNGTWITQEIVDSYIELFKQGHAYSVEVYQSEKLVGGLYGVCLNGVVTGESMFMIESGASKLALFSLMKKLHSKGIHWLDTQMVTPIVESFGGEEIARSKFLERINKASPLSRTEIFS